jgi:hypothetical protein
VQRVAAFPDVKTIVEFGLPQATIGIWYGLFGPPKIPESVLSRLSAELRTMSNTSDTQIGKFLGHRFREANETGLRRTVRRRIGISLFARY